MCNTCTTSRIKVPKIAKWYDTSNPFTLPFFITFPLIVLPSSIYTNGPNQSNWLSYSFLQIPLYMYRASSRSYISKCIFLRSTNFPLSQPIPKTQNNKGKTEKKTRRKQRKTKNNTTPQTKWYGHALNINKAANQSQQITKDQNHKTRNRHHDSIPMVPSVSKGKLNLRLLQDFMAFSLACNPLHHISMNA